MSEIRPAEPHEKLAALQRIFQYLPPDDALTRMRGMIGLMGTPGPEQPQLLVVAEGEQIVGAILLQVLVGGTGILWPPQVLQDWPDADSLAERLVHAAVSRLHDRGAKLIQSVLMRGEEAMAAPLLRAGFQQPTHLLYLRHELELAPELLCAPEKLRFQAYRDCRRDLFHGVLMRTYDETGDFPEMNGRRSLEDILAGLQAVGFDPSRWWLATDWSGAVGVLALNEVDADAWEIAYVGVTPGARRRGCGRELVRKALFETKAGGAHELILSVDSRNEPALQLYRSLGFDEYDRRAVYLLLE